MQFARDLYDEVYRNICTVFVKIVYTTIRTDLVQKISSDDVMNGVKMRLVLLLLYNTRVGNGFHIRMENFNLYYIFLKFSSIISFF